MYFLIKKQICELPHKLRPNNLFIFRVDISKKKFKIEKRLLILVKYE